MTTKSILITGALALASFTAASAKTYDFSLDSPTKVGTVELKPGQYRVKVDGSNAVFMPTDGSKSVTAPVKIENADQKFSQTMVLTHNNSNGTDNLKEIDLGGSHNKLAFGD
jgi:hypothetical protein